MNVVYIDDESREVEIFIDEILQILNLEYNRYIYDCIIKFINKPSYKLMIISDLYRKKTNIEEYEELIKKVKI